MKKAIILKPLDFVKNESGHISMVMHVKTENDKQYASIAYIDRTVEGVNCWIPADELEVINSLPLMLAKQLAAPMEYPVSCMANAINSFPI